MLKGFVPSKGVMPPQGAIVAGALEQAKPIMSLEAACIV